MQPGAPCASPLGYPTAVFAGCRIKHRKTRRSLSPDRDRMLATTFRSPATNPAFADSIPGSKFLAYRFASCLTRADDPFGSSLRCRSARFAPGDRQPPRLEPVAALTRPARLPLPRHPLPFRAFAPFRIRAFHRLCCKLARLPAPPDSRLLPAAAFYY